MGTGGERLHGVLEGYDRFLIEKDLSSQKERPYLVRWVREFLLFARAHGGFTFEQTLDLFLAQVGERIGTKPWQLQQAADAVRIYRYQYRAAGDDGADGPARDAYLNSAVMLDRFRDIIRLRHYARSTEKTYLHWTRRLLAYRRQVGDAGEGEPTAAEVKAFLSRLAMVEKVSASTQNQAFSALLLLFREVLRVDLEEMSQTVRAKRGPKLPTVLSVAEVQALLNAVEPEYRLMVKLLYGSGMPLMELLRLRVKDLDFDAGLERPPSQMAGKVVGWPRFLMSTSAATSDSRVYFGSPPAFIRCFLRASGHDHGRKWRSANLRRWRRNASPK